MQILGHIHQLRWWPTPGFPRWILVPVISREVWHVKFQVLAKWLTAVIGLRSHLLWSWPRILDCFSGLVRDDFVTSVDRCPLIDRCQAWFLQIGRAPVDWQLLTLTSKFVSHACCLILRFFFYTITRKWTWISTLKYVGQIRKYLRAVFQVFSLIFKSRAQFCLKFCDQDSARFLLKFSSKFTTTPGIRSWCFPGF